MRKPESNPSRRLTGLAIALLLILSAVAVIQAYALPSMPAPMGDEGPWSNAVSSIECPHGSVCAEWPNRDYNTLTLCCIAPNVVGTYNKPDSDSCWEILGVRPLN